MSRTQAFIYRTLMSAAWLMLGYSIAHVYPVTFNQPVPVIDAQGTATYRPIKALDDGWYLVEVEQQYTCDNPLPIGNKEMTVIVPHLVRMRASELDNLNP